ncbi:sigma-70 family RNA polymerase sigma factor [Microbacterium sp. BWT-B31]|uniref:sigma-70 family RNA polymerase sigma factor n=1 Tax=Microbacterium sp. BWT-B31 TaxID=3232072 RepID=UPI0035276E67
MAAVDTGVVTGFEAEVAPLRGELLAHCYRMLGNPHDAEDALQEALLRGWRGWPAFEGRSSVRTWLYAIATRACLDAIRSRAARPGEVVVDPGLLPAAVEPFAGRGDDLRLAFIVALQRLPARQRAALLLRDVLGFTAVEASDVLEISVPAVKSALQRARAATADVVGSDVVEPDDPVARRALDVYMAAFVRGDVDALIALLRADAVLDLGARGGAFQGRVECEPVLRDAVRSAEWSMRPVVRNAQPAVVVHHDGAPFGVAVLDVRRDGVARITVFAEPRLVDAGMAGHEASVQE